MIPFGARVGVGAIGTALAATSAGIPPVGLTAAAAALTAGLVALRAVRTRQVGWWGRGGVGLLLGAWIVIGRFAVGAEAGTPGSVALPPGPGPWTGRVTAIATPRDGTQRLTVAIDDPLGLVLAVTAPRYPLAEPGDRVRIGGRPLAPPEGGYGDYLRRTGVAGTLRARPFESLGREADAAGLLERTRRAAGDALARALPEPAAGLAAGILVGLRDRVDRDLAAAFTTTGMSHVVAISGWNIALVAGLVGAVLAGRSRRTRSGAIVVAILAYAVLAGASASVVRAAAMAGIALLARESGRPGTAAAALGWAVAVLVIVTPASAGDVGLQLSAAATAGLIAWSAPITGWLDRRAGRLPRWIRDGLGVSLAAQATTLPIVLLAFGRVAPLSPALNLAVVPLVPAAMAAGAVALGGGAVAAAGGPGLLAVVAGIPGALVLGLLIAIVEGAATLPAANVSLDPPAGALLAAALTLGLGVVVARRRAAALVRTLAATARRPPAAPSHAQRTSSTTGSRPRRLARGAAVAGVLALAVLVVAAATRPDGRAHVVALDVGQGDAILVTGPTGGRMLVDGGPDPERLLVALDARFPPWDRRIDLVIVSHPHEDHVAGLPLLLERYRVGQVAEPGMPGQGPGYEALAAVLAGAGQRSYRLAAGTGFVLDGVRVEVLWPDGDRVPREPSDDGGVVNDSSIVLLGTFEGRRFLLTGDAEADVEEELVERGLPPVDVLKTGHHGSRTSSTAEFVAATRPRVALVSVGARNDYGHPYREVLDRLTAAGAAVLRTDLAGTIDVALDAEAIEVRTERPVPRPAATTAADQGPEGRPRSGLRGEIDRAAPAVRAAPTVGAVRAVPAVAGGRATVVPADPGAPAGLPYDRRDVRPVARGRRRPPPLARPAGLAPAPCPRRRRGGRLARGAGRSPRIAGGPPARRGGRAPPRRRQGAPALRSRRGAAPRGGFRGVVGRPRPRRAGSGGSRAPGDPPPGRRRRGVARQRAAGGLPRRVRRQAGRTAARVDERPLRGLAPPLPRRLEHRRRRPRPGRRRRAGAPRVRARGRGPERRPPPALDRVGDSHGAAQRGGRRGMSGPALGYYWGDDEFGLDAAATALGRLAAGPGGEPPTPWRTTGAATRPAEIAERVATATLFGGGTLVIVEDPGPLVRAQAERDALGAAISALAPGNALAFVESVDGTARRLKSLEELAAAVAAAGGEVRQVAAPREGGMARWIEQRATERGVPLERGAAEALARRVGAFVREGDVDRRRMGRLAVAELEKLAVYRLDAPIRAEDVDALVADAVPGSTWAFLDAVGARKSREAAPLLERLLVTTPEPVLVAMLHRRIRELLLVADHRARGDTVQATARALKLKEFPARKLWEQGHAWTAEELGAALEGLLELDAAMKGERGSDARRRRLAFAVWLAERVARA